MIVHSSVCLSMYYVRVALTMRCWYIPGKKWNFSYMEMCQPIGEIPKTSLETSADKFQY